MDGLVMDESLRPALISIYLLLNFCTLIRMMSVDYDGFVRSIWGNRWMQRNFEVRLKLEKLSAALVSGHIRLALQCAGVPGPSVMGNK